jgi:hypothetical protein
MQRRRAGTEPPRPAASPWLYEPGGPLTKMGDGDFGVAPLNVRMTSGAHCITI